MISIFSDFITQVSCNSRINYCLIHNFPTHPSYTQRHVVQTYTEMRTITEHTISDLIQYRTTDFTVNNNNKTLRSG